MVADAMDPPAAWLSMQKAVRNMGHQGLAATAISAVDGALWDLKAKLLDLPLCMLLGRYRDSLPRLRQRRLHHLLRRRIARAALSMGRSRRLPLGENEDRHASLSAIRTACGGQTRHRRAHALRRRERRLCPQAGAGVCRSVRARGAGRLVRGAGLVRRSGRASVYPPARAGDAWRSPQANMAMTSVISAAC